jgi:hypothetical protein
LIYTPPLPTKSETLTDYYDRVETETAGRLKLYLAALDVVSVASLSPRMFYDPRSFAKISRAYWPRPPGTGSRSLHHWLFPQRARLVPEGVQNAGLNLLEINRGLNVWMGFAARWGGTHALKAWAVENGIRAGLTAYTAAAAYGSYRLHLEVFGD